MSVPHSREELVQRILMGQENNHTFHFFHGHIPKRNGIIDRSCLSQWFPSSFMINGVKYTTAEHFMMAEKARLFDMSLVDDIIHAPHPKDAKALGRCVANFDSNVWDQCSFDIVTRGSVAKFSQNENLKEYLLSVEESIFVEAAPTDKVWGIGLNRMDRDAKNPVKWKGENKLGFALTVARKEIIHKMSVEGDRYM